jgi:hypothetical protein
MPYFFTLVRTYQDRVEERVRERDLLWQISEDLPYARERRRYRAGPLRGAAHHDEEWRTLGQSGRFRQLEPVCADAHHLQKLTSSACPIARGRRVRRAFIASQPSWTQVLGQTSSITVHSLYPIIDPSFPP